MSIKPENKARYPKNWKEIRAAILERAGHKCERCGAENYQPHPVTGSKVVLTVAHLDHTLENCSPENLQALCQKCHLAYDHQHHRENARHTRNQKKGQGILF